MGKRIDFSDKFDKNLRRASIKIKIRFRERLEIFLKNRGDPRLNDHSLIGEYRGCRSINITGDWRAIYEERDNEIIFVALGTHSQLYG